MVDSRSSSPAIEAEGALVLETLQPLRTSGDEMPLPQLRMLLSLASGGPQTVKCLADGLKLHESAVEVLCAVLVAHGSVVRIPSDSGAIVVALSTGGRRRVDDVISHDALAASRLPTTHAFPTKF